MSRRDDENVEGGNVRDDIPGSINLGSGDLWTRVGVREVREIDGQRGREQLGTMG